MQRRGRRGIRDLLTHPGIEIEDLIFASTNREGQNFMDNTTERQDCIIPDENLENAWNFYCRPLNDKSQQWKQIIRQKLFLILNNIRNPTLISASPTLLLGMLICFKKDYQRDERGK